MAHRDVTLHDIAREAGVAVSTASRALSNPGRVSHRTRENVTAVANRLGYRPNRIAQALPSGRTGMLALLIPDITNPHNFGLIRGAEAQGRAAGYTLILADAEGSSRLESDHVSRLDSVVDGFLLASSRLAEDDVRALAARRPVVLYNRVLDGVASVVTDADDGCRQVVDHLAAIGHRSVAYLEGPHNAWINGGRKEALIRHSGARDVELTVVGPFAPTVDQGAAAADIGLATGATALVAFNDLLAIGALCRLEHLGVTVPGAVSVVGFDDIFGASFCNPPLTTVRSSAEQAGRHVIDLLLGARSDSRVLIPCDLLVRDSTGPPPRRP